MAATKSSEKSTKNVYFFSPEIELDVLASPQTDASETDRPEIIDKLHRSSILGASLENLAVISRSKGSYKQQKIWQSSDI